MRCERCGGEHEPTVVGLAVTLELGLTIAELSQEAEQLETDVAHRLRDVLEAMIADGMVLRFLEAQQARLCRRPATGQQG